MSETRNAVEGLFGPTPEGPRLFGSECEGCGTPYFPRSEFCHNPRCSGGAMRDARFGPHGTLWSCAVQNYPPPAPAVCDTPYRPYAVGLVDLDNGLRVLGRIATDAPDDLEPGSAVELILAPLGHDAAGTEIVSWHFKPVGGS